MKPKFFYQVEIDGAIIDSRKSNREYSHAVVQILNHRQTREGWKPVPEYFGACSFSGSETLAQKELGRIQALHRDYGAQNPHLAISGKIVPVKKTIL